ncbi:hypothetical protein Cgig2_000714 [Carnegiea gigantea]|uniref:Uncharacterized protein n=1 Tax=Carnegiea gigantea TaxID=171969 RepID=A0A9Q1KDE8_9CARY|nr:hypothetical protein Cgig2_000714 [Carnegiea gigantea]
MTDEALARKEPNAHGGIKKSPSCPTFAKKGAGPMHVIRVAMHMLRRKKSGKKTGSNNPSSTALPLPASVTNDALTRLVGSVRPFHLQDSVGGSMLSPPPPPPPLLLPPPSPEWGSGGWHMGSPGAAMGSPGGQSEGSYFSMRHSHSSSSLGGDTISTYHSVQSLQDLGITDGEEGDAYYDGLEGDELIDSKAEMFIAQFYKDMKHNSEFPSLILRTIFTA